MTDHSDHNSFRLTRLVRNIGPAIIVATVVLGPGSILTASKVGCQYGYSMLWVLVFAAALMLCVCALTARLGIGMEKTLCSVLADRIGRPFAVIVGIILFLVVACFQTGNNMAVVTSIESLLISEAPEGNGAVVDGASNQDGNTVQKLIVLLLLLNGLLIAALFGLKKLYQPLERLMKLMLLLLLICFGVNCFLAEPTLAGVFSGLVPSFLFEEDFRLWPTRDASGNVVDPLWAVQGLVATTFSVAGAYYQSYLVREKGWTAGHLKQGFLDSVIGISVLCVCSAMIMITSAAVLHGKISPQELKSAADVAIQLQPMFGQAAKVLFACGIFAACFSPLLVNAMIGGTLLADGLGIGHSIDRLSSRVLTVFALLVGMGVAIWATAAGKSPVGVIIFAQSLTVIGVPLLMGSLLYMATRPDVRANIRFPAWMYAGSILGFAVSIVLAARTGWKIYLGLSGSLE